jgi:hypothetical protein
MKMMWSAMSRAKHLVDDAPGIAVPSVGSLRNGNAQGYVKAAVESPPFGTTLTRHAPTEFVSVRPKDAFYCPDLKG